MGWDEQAVLACGNPPTAMLLAGGFARAALGKLSAEERAPFDSLHRALRGWIPKRRPEELNAIYETWWPQTMAVDVAHNSAGHPSRHAMTCAYLQVYCVMKLLKGRVLPADGFYDMSDEDFVRIGREVAKASKTSVGAMTHRVDSLLELKGKFDAQCALVDRMLWEVEVRERTVPSRLRPALLHLSSGGSWQWRDLGGTRMLKLPRPGAAITLRLDEEELAILASYVPDLAS